MVARTLILRAAAALKSHVPMIKFRKGGLQPSDPRSQAQKAGSSPTTAQSSHPTPSTSSARPTIEDYQLPPKYRRSPLSDAEIAYINRGGPE